MENDKPILKLRNGPSQEFMIWFFIVFWITLSIISTKLVGTILGILLASLCFYVLVKEHRYLILYEDKIVLHFYFKKQLIPISTIKTVYSRGSKFTVRFRSFGFIYLVNGNTKNCKCIVPLNLKAKKIFDFLKDKGVDVPVEAYTFIVT